MFKFIGKNLHITRTESGSITINSKKGFNIGDTIEFNVYEVDGLDSAPILPKSVKITEETHTAVIELLSADTDLGDPTNETTEYWFQIRKNGEKTILGFDDNGAKILYLYPCGIDKK